jgi:lipopolysaccharide export system protein LptA
MPGSSYPGKRRIASQAAALLLALLLPAAISHALPDDNEQPIRITADTAIRDEKQGFTVYSGSVRMIQGSLEIEADKITIYHASAQADKIVAEGKPAKMQQKPAVDKPLVKARAEMIEYFKNEDRVHLTRNAYITQDDSSVTGDSIDYFIAEQLVKADSDKDTDGNRVKVVISPKAIREDDADSGTTEGN